jgi:hypothetical protein
LIRHATAATVLATADAFDCAGPRGLNKFMAMNELRANTLRAGQDGLHGIGLDEIRIKRTDASIRDWI